MFLRRLGNQLFLLHSYRDGRGKVRHRRLGQWRGTDGVSNALEQWENWRTKIEAHHPEVRVNWARLRARAEQLGEEIGQSDVGRRGETLTTPPSKRGPIHERERPAGDPTETLLRTLAEKIASLEDVQSLRQVRERVIETVGARLCLLGVVEEGAQERRAGRWSPGGEEGSRARVTGPGGDDGADIGDCPEARLARRCSPGGEESAEARGAGLSSTGGEEGARARVTGPGGDDGADIGDCPEARLARRCSPGGEKGAKERVTGLVGEDSAGVRDDGADGGTVGGEEDEEDWQFGGPTRAQEEEDSLDWLTEEPTFAEALQVELEQGSQALAAGSLVSAEQSAGEALRRLRGGLGRRRRFEPSDESGALYLRALDLMGEVRRRQGLGAEACRLAQLRAEACPDEMALYRYGAALHQQGRLEEALGQYSRAPYRRAWRYYLSAAAACGLGRREESIDFLLAGLVRDRRVAEELRIKQAGKPVPRPTGFWEQFGSLWDPASLSLLVAVAGVPAVRGRVSACVKDGVLRRKLFFTHGRKVLSLRVQAVLEGKRYCILTGRVVDA